MNDIISKNSELYDSVERSIRGFSPLESLKSSVQIENFILLTNVTSNVQTSSVDMKIDSDGVPFILKTMENKSSKTIDIASKMDDTYNSLYAKKFGTSRNCWFWSKI